MDNNILTANDQYLKQLDSKSSVEFFRDLIWAEASRVGIPPSKINISLRVTVPDGGIDATIDADNISLQLGGLFEEGKNSYQIKAGENFKPQNKPIIKKELFDNKTPSVDNLAPEVKSCLEQNGKYVIVCFGLDLIDAERKKAISNLKELLKICGFTNSKVDVWSINNLKGFIQKYPAIALQTNQLYGEPFRTHKEWSNLTDMRVPFEVGKEQQEILESIQEQLRKSDEPSQLRILGEAGVGKTESVNDLRQYFS